MEILEEKEQQNMTQPKPSTENQQIPISFPNQEDEVPSQPKEENNKKQEIMDAKNQITRKTDGEIPRQIPPERRQLNRFNIPKQKKDEDDDDILKIMAQESKLKIQFQQKKIQPNDNFNFKTEEQRRAEIKARTEKWQKEQKEEKELKELRNKMMEDRMPTPKVKDLRNMSTGDLSVYKRPVTVQLTSNIASRPYPSPDVLDSASTPKAPVTKSEPVPQKVEVNRLRASADDVDRNRDFFSSSKESADLQQTTTDNAANIIAPANRTLPPIKRRPASLRLSMSEEQVQDRKEREERKLKRMSSIKRTSQRPLYDPSLFKGTENNNEEYDDENMEPDNKDGPEMLRNRSASMAVITQRSNSSHDIKQSTRPRSQSEDKKCIIS